MTHMHDENHTEGETLEWHATCHSNSSYAGPRQIRPPERGGTAGRSTDEPLDVVRRVLNWTASLQTLDSATSATIIRWGGDTLGVDYRFPGGERDAHALGPDDRLFLDRLRRAGQLGYIDDDIRRRYVATLK